MLRRTAANPKMPGRLVRPGLSLMEVLLATVIFLMALGGISVLINSAVENAFQATRTNTASSYARSKMADLEAGTGDTTVSSGGSGTFDNDPAWNWRVTSTELSPGTYDVELVVWQEAGAARRTEVVLSQIIFDPNLLNNAATAKPPETGTTTP